MLEVKKGNFYLNGEKYNIYSGAMHYFRVLPYYWKDRLQKLKAAGLNTVETYVCWNLHEPKHNEFDFSGMLDIKKYIQTAKEVGLNVILRPGPYICAEWDFGGLPAWLLKDKNMRLRCYDEKYLGYVENYLKTLFSELDECFSSNGGNIIAVQVENEYGSYGTDKKYLNAVKKIYDDCGIKELMFTSDGYFPQMFMGGYVDDVVTTVNLGSLAKTRLKALRDFDPNAPLMCTEFWCGWFDHWTELHHRRPVASVMKEVNDFLSVDASFNFYMFHGGTNFGFNAGANYYDKYLPCATSYDYYAPLNEYGDYTKLYYAVRDALTKKQGITTELPPRPQTQYIGKVMLNNVTSLFDNLDNIGEKHHSPLPESMEYYGQNFGMIYYKNILKGKYGMSRLELIEPNDFAYFYVDGKLKSKTSVMDNSVQKLKHKKEMICNFTNEQTELSVLVDAWGRTNYGHHLTDTKGLHGLNLGLQHLMDWEVTTLPLNNLEKLDFSKNCGTYPLFYKGEFVTDNTNECFVEFKNFTKGAIFVNGFNLGRYWKKGPQKTLYLPGCLLHTDKPNEIIVMEMENCKEPSVVITNKHNLG